jgi:hypothetical protein
LVRNPTCCGRLKTTSSQQPIEGGVHSHPPRLEPQKNLEKAVNLDNYAEIPQNEKISIPPKTKIEEMVPARMFLELSARYGSLLEERAKILCLIKKIVAISVKIQKIHNLRISERTLEYCSTMPKGCKIRKTQT